ncbi:ABC1 kinase family protein [Methanoregula sp. UBA64]|jgi:ubiquinone biosynthesis protein|uniref:ABC1 kinase family protein n=1 Tax=Methanoregula sp. UBA64 TaxID=1915554 RepID=UPI0025E81716|nr:AarF/ABC1/UbiB kinase family protein [Methanoregula sp. UBA64]
MVTRIRRYAQIIDVLTKYGFGIALEKAFPGRTRFRLPGSESSQPDQSTTYERIRMALEELGPTFVKFGQIMSTRTEIFPPELIAQLKKLQDHAKPLPFSDVVAVLHQSCPDLGDWFSEIDETPVASASIGQVHRAVLRDGTVVAVKIQRPGIPDQIENDLAILQSMAERIEAVFPESRMYNPVGLVQDFANQIRKELDFTRDGRNMERMARNFRDVPGIHFPKVYWDYSSPHILVMEFVKGVRVDNIEAIKAQGCNPHDIALRGFYAYLKMIFEDGFFHGDPHPGNMLVSETGDLVLLDFGIVGVLRPEKKQLFINLLFALTTDDVDMILKALEGFGIVVAEENREALRDDLYIMLHDFGGGDQIAQFNFGLMINELTEVMRHYNIKVPMSLMLLLKTLVMVYDVAIHLDPKFSFGEEITPYLRKLTDSNVLSAGYAKRASNSLLEAVDAAFDLPRNVNLMLKRLSTGTVRLEVVDTDLKKLQMALDRASDKIMIGLVVAALVVGSSLVLQASPVTMPKEVMWIAILGYTAAVLCGFYAIYHVIFLKLRLER